MFVIALKYSQIRLNLSKIKKRLAYVMNLCQQEDLNSTLQRDTVWKDPSDKPRYHTPEGEPSQRQIRHDRCDSIQNHIGAYCNLVNKVYSAAMTVCVYHLPS